MCRDITSPTEQYAVSRPPGKGGQAASCKSDSFFFPLLVCAASKGETKGLIQSLLTKCRISLLDLVSPWILAAVQPLTFSTLEETLAAISPRDGFFALLFNL